MYPNLFQAADIYKTRNASRRETLRACRQTIFKWLKCIGLTYKHFVTILKIYVVIIVFHMKVGVKVLEIGNTQVQTFQNCKLYLNVFVAQFPPLLAWRQHCGVK